MSPRVTHGCQQYLLVCLVALVAGKGGLPSGTQEPGVQKFNIHSKRISLRQLSEVASGPVVAELQMDLHGSNLIPFSDDLRQTAVDVLDSVLSSVHLSEIAMEAVEEYLPLEGPGSQTFFGGLSPSVLSSRLVIPRASAPAVSATYGSDPGIQPPFVRLMMVISSAPENVTLLQAELADPKLPSELLDKWVKRGVNISRLDLVKIPGALVTVPPSARISDAPSPAPLPGYHNAVDYRAVGGIIAAVLALFAASGGGYAWYRWRAARANQASELPKKDQRAHLEKVKVEPDTQLHLTPFSVAVPSGQRLKALGGGTADAVVVPDSSDGTPCQQEPPLSRVPQPPMRAASTALSDSETGSAEPASVRLRRVLSPFERAGYQITAPPIALGCRPVGKSLGSSASAEHAQWERRPSGEVYFSRSAESQGREDFLVSRRPTDDGDVAGSGSQLRHLNSGSSAHSVSQFPAQLDCGVPMLEFQELQILRSIGRGSYGEVFLGKWREVPVALKVLHLQSRTTMEQLHQGGNEGPDSLTMRRLSKEASVAASLRHPNTVLLMGLCLDPPCLVTEYCSRGSVLDVLQRAREDQVEAAPLTWSRRICMALDAAKGMLYLHSQCPPVLHRDLKSANLMVDKHWNVKVADFNLARLKSLDENAATGFSSNAALNPRCVCFLHGLRLDL
eukprot:jgi/Botrbrau1/21166/Bobra.0061s0059.2